MSRLIDADKFANHFCELCNQEGCEGYYENDNMKCTTRAMMEEALKDAQTIVPEHESTDGHWYWDGTYMDCTGWRCSKCGEFFADSIYDQDGYRDDPMEFPSKYCPGCGARMEWVK